MQLLEIEITNWCQIPQLHVQFDNLGRPHLINGKNNKGKTNFLKAICFALDLTPAKNTARYIRRAKDVDSASVTLKFKEGQHIHEIKRILTKTKGGNTIHLDGNPDPTPITEALKIFQEDWGCTHPEQLLSLLILPQKRADILILETNKNREERLGRIKGFHRIKPKIAAIDKKRKALKSQREALAAEGIVTTDKDIQKTDVETSITIKKQEIQTLEPQILPPEQIALHKEALCHHQLQPIEKDIETKLNALPDWASTWKNTMQEALTQKKPYKSANTIINDIQNSIASEANNTQIEITNGRIEMNRAKAPDPKTWDTLKAAHSHETNAAATATIYELDPKTIPSTEELKTYDIWKQQSDLHAEAQKAKNAHQSTTGGPLPYDTEVLKIHLAFETIGTPKLCPVSNNTLTPEGIQTAKAKYEARKAAGLKNTSISRFISLAAANQALKTLASIDKITELINTIQDAHQKYTPEIQAVHKRKNDIINLRNKLQIAEAATKNAIQCFPNWEIMNETQKAQTVARIQNIQNLTNKLRQLGDIKTVSPERFDNESQKEILIRLETQIIIHHNLKIKITQPEEAAAIARTKSEQQIGELLKNQELLNRGKSEKQGELTTLEKNLRTITAEIKNIRERKEQHDAKKAEEDAHTEAYNFLQPGNGPRELLLLDLQDAIQETNERLYNMGIDLALDCDNELQIYSGTSETIGDPETRDLIEDLGGGFASLVGVFLHIAFLHQFNETVTTGKIENLIMDEPTAAIQPPLKPGFYNSITSLNPVTGIIMVEHEPSAESFAHTITPFN
jgi:hypothetical protein